MEQLPLGRAHLESLSTSDLVRLADEHGIDIPEGLNRRFIIGELLELGEENLRAASDSALVIDGEFTIPADILPETYNETQITLLMRDPGWVFVYWDFHTTLLTAVTGNHRFESFFLRVNSLSGTNRERPSTILTWTWEFTIASGIFIFPTGSKPVGLTSTREIPRRRSNC